MADAEFTRQTLGSSARHLGSIQEAKRTAAHNEDERSGYLVSLHDVVTVSKVAHKIHTARAEDTRDACLALLESLSIFIQED